MFKDIEADMTSEEEERPKTYTSPIRSQNSILNKPISKIKKVDAKTLDRIF